MNESFLKAASDAAAKLASVRIVPVLALNSESDALRLCEILMKYGLGAVEITFRTREAAAILSAVTKHFSELFAGAGTILNPADLRRAMDAGAHFAVAPGFNPRVVSAAIEDSFAFAPGVCTPSEIEQACELGCRFLKFFPAEAAGGTAMLKSMSAPYKHLGLRFMPTGGVSAKNAADYLALDAVAAVGGTWLGKSADMEAGKWDEIAEAVRAAAEIVKQHPAKN